MDANRRECHFTGMGWTALALVLAVVVGVLDYVTGPEMSFAVFYLLPVALAAWKNGLAPGVFVGLVSTAIWFQADYLGAQEYSRAWLAYWNAGVRVAFFGLTILLVNKVRRLTLSLGEKAASLSEQIAERERVEKALAENQKVFQLITENASDLITVVDIEGRRRYSSPSSRNSRGVVAVPGSDFFADVDPADRERVQGVFRQALKTGLNQRAEYRLGDGEEPSRYLESEWNVIREDQGEPRTVVVVSRDITLRKRMEMLYANEKDTLEMIARGKPLREVLRSILYKVQSWSDQALCSILVRDAEQNAVWHEASPALQLPLTARGERKAREEAPASAGCDPTASQATFEHEWLSCREQALKSGLQIAFEKAILSTAGEALGVLTIYSRAQHTSEMLGLQFFEKIAHVTAIALERQRSEEMLRRLNSLLLDAQETERRRVARELHDSVNQILSSVAFRVQAILPGIAAESDAVKQELVRVHFLLQKAMHEVRSISENLRPSELDELGLIAAVRELCEDFKERNRVAVEFQAPAGPERLSSAIELALYRIVQEALTNIQKHAQASEAWLRLAWDEAWVNLVVRDNGRGSASTTAAAAAPGRLRFGMGLMDMRERCRLLGGSFSIQSAPAGGTEIAVRIPRNPMPQMGLRNG